MVEPSFIRFLSFALVFSLLISALFSLAASLAPGFWAFVRQRTMSLLGLLPARKKTWGTVYDSQTKRPVPFAKVQLFDEQKRLLEARVADREGRYGFLIMPTAFLAQNLKVYILVSQNEYIFPSKNQPSVDKFIYNNLYYGELVEVDQSKLINFDIPLDPVRPASLSGAQKKPSVVRGALLAGLADLSFWLGLIMVPLSYILVPNRLNLAVLVVFVGAACLRLFGIVARPFGVVQDAQTGQPLPFSLINLVDQGGRRVGFTVSDERGRYFLLVGKGDYELTAFTASTIQPPRQTKQVIRAKKGWVTRQIRL